MSHTATAAVETSDGPRPAIQLHTVRSIDAPLPELIRYVADAGYQGVEFAGAFLDADPRAVERALTETDVVPVAAHVDLSRLEDDLEPIVDRCRIVGCDRVIVPHLGSHLFRTTATVDALASRLDGFAERLDSHGIELGYHTSREPFLPPLDRFGLGTVSSIPLPAFVWKSVADAADRWLLRGNRQLDRTAFSQLAYQTDTMTFEIDVGWVAAGGYDPVEAIESLGDRLSLVHLADVRQTRVFPPAFRSVPPGEGLIDPDEILAAVDRSNADWVIFEDDDPDDPEAAIWKGIATLCGRPV
ncbi:sugar phosphate isomerase/epimerase [Halorubrum sp. Ea8]|uniref:sugar phosphate isomerase/epimerase family protein n=1 Tax=Halorubrum sp. Ea8 TaxID=1383841 RepID=UPI000B984D39|nr:sugar phosphate isomerase/epimerase [Halorubrum sp. Ea8]OYR48359.1 sugar phosphate isomerase [Halorubrum sp. Ea8]